MQKNQYWYLFVVGLLLFIHSCKVLKNDNMDNGEVVIFPAPPDTARIQFLTSINSSMDIVKKQSKFVTSIIGEKTPLHIVKPYGVNVRYGKIFVCDVTMKCIVVIDLENKTFNYFNPSGKGAIKTPINCYLDYNQNLYVADIGRKEILIYDNNLKYISSIKGEPEFLRPIDVEISDNKIWICDMKRHKIQVYKNDSTRKLLFSFPDKEPRTEGYLYQPQNISVVNNEVYISDAGEFNVKVYSINGEYIRTIGSQGNNYGQFARPKGIAVDRESYLYAVDFAFQNVQIFNEKGEILMPFGGVSNKKGNMVAPVGIYIDYENTNYFKSFVDPDFDLQYLIFVANQFGVEKLNVYGRIKLKEKLEN